MPPATCTHPAAWSRAAKGQSVYVCTHQVRAYTDGFLAFNVNRDNATTPGSVLICVSGYLV